MRRIQALSLDAFAELYEAELQEAHAAAGIFQLDCQTKSREIEGLRIELTAACNVIERLKSELECANVQPNAEVVSALLRENAQLKIDAAALLMHASLSSQHTTKRTPQPEARAAIVPAKYRGPNLTIKQPPQYSEGEIGWVE